MSKVATGPRVVFKIDGSKVAYASGFQYTVTHQLEQINVLDQLEAAELAEVGYETSFSCNTFIIAGSSAVTLGFQPKLEDILTQPELTAEVHDEISDQVIIRFIGVKLTTNSGDIGARAAGNASLNFMAIKAELE